MLNIHVVSDEEQGRQSCQIEVGGDVIRIASELYLVISSIYRQMSKDDEALGKLFQLSLAHLMSTKDWDDGPEPVFAMNVEKNKDSEEK